MRKKLIVLTTILGLIAFSGVAAAQEHDPEDTEETGDTTFNYGYDEDNGIFIWGSSPSDGEDCALENGELEVIYGSQNGGLLEVDLANLDEDCQLTGGEVAGPQGQVNHGMFLKTFNAMFDGQARGCMVRYIAQSDMGKDDQQVNPDVDPGVEGVEEGDTGEIEFETVLADCLHGPDDEEVEGVSNGKGRPDWVTNMLNSKGGDDDGEQVESQDEDSGQQGPPDDVPGKGPKG